MKTNQIMSVRLGNYGSISIGHKDQVGNLRHVLEIGNAIRVKKGLPPKELRAFFRMESTWEYVIKLWNEREKENGYTTEHSVLFNTIKALPKDGHNQIDETAIFKTRHFQDIVYKKNRGKLPERGIWGSLYLLLDLALWLDVDLKHEVYKTFIEGKILEYRDQSGEAYKELCRAMDDKGLIKDHWDYARVAKAITFAVMGTTDKEQWNDATEQQLEQRKDIEVFLTEAITVGFITGLNMVFDYISKQKITLTNSYTVV